MRFRGALPLAFALSLCLGATAAGAANADCPQPVDVKVAHILGLWHAEIEGERGATLLFETHPDYADSVRGSINRDGERGALSGEMEDGEFSMEESADGQHIFATWMGEFVEGSCGREIRGTWQRDGAPLAHRFVMKKLP